MPKAQPAKTYPAHDAHPTEAATVALDPYDMADKADIFSVHYNEEGLLPIFLVITNEGEQPIALAGMKAQLVTVNRTKMSPATVDDIYRRLSRPRQTVRRRESHETKRVLSFGLSASVQSFRSHHDFGGFVFYGYVSRPENRANPLTNRAPNLSKSNLR